MNDGSTHIETSETYPLKLQFSCKANPWETATTETFKFATAWDLLNHFADSNGNDRGRFQTAIDRVLKENTSVKEWHRLRTRFADLVYFNKYRGFKSPQFQEASRAVNRGNASAYQLELYEGLRSEILQSRVALPAGQVLFHGRGEDDLSSGDSFPSFISTTLNVVVALNISSGRPGKNFVYELTLLDELPVLWGHWHSNCEWELLLPPDLVFIETNRRCGSKFTLIAATVSRK